MLFRFNTFKSVAFVEKPDVLTIDGYRLEYLGFCKDEHKGKTPIVFIGGAFQNFFSFKKEVQRLSQDFPIVLLDLPSQGTNTQLASDLDFQDFAQLLLKFCDHFEIEKITPLALSYGSATAYYFASLYPERVHKMILGGTSPQIRPSIRKLLLESIRVLESGEQKLFAEGAVLNLINFSKREQTKISQRIIKGFFENMQCLKPNCIQRYIQNTIRLLNLETLEGTPVCETLVLTGEYDSFTSPYENVMVAQQIPHAQMVLIKDADHLANLERRDILIDLYEHFLKDQGIQNLDGIINIDINLFSEYEKRLNPRKKLNDVKVKLIDSKQNQITAMLEDINYFGCKLNINLSEDNFNYDSQLKFKFDDSQVTLNHLELSGFLFDTQDMTSARCIFKRSSFEKAQELENFLSQ